MRLTDHPRALAVAVQAARTAGAVIRRNLGAPKQVQATTSHDIKLELDVRCQRVIEEVLRRGFPDVPILGEEGATGTAAPARRWIVDPIDGTVNFAHGVPHVAVLIALQERNPKPEVGSVRRASRVKQHATRNTPYETVVAVIYDPLPDELWTAIQGQPARLNGRRIRVSNRRRLSEAMVSFGFAKTKANIRRSLPYFEWLARRARKVRIQGAAGLDLAYVACGRFDACLERGIRLWDLAAGGLIVECAGGRFWHERIRGQDAYRMVASNRWLHDQLPVPH